MHPRQVHELRDLGTIEKRSADGEEFANAIWELHEEVKQKLQDSSLKCKARVDLKWREVNFKEGDLVMVHLKNDIFLRGTYKKLKWKKIDPWKILINFSANAYEIELLRDVGISPIFNVSDLYPYHVEKSSHPTMQEGVDQKVPWEALFLKSRSTIP